VVERVAERLRALEDREAIRDLIARYGPLADSGDAAGVAALFAEDAVYAVGGMGEAQGREAIAALIEGPVHRELMANGCAHVLTSPAIDLAGDRATARCHSVVFRKEGEGWQAVRVSANRWELARVGKGWQVARRDNRLLDGSEAAQVLLGNPAS